MSSPVTSEAQFQPASDQSLLVSFGEGITLQAHQQVVRLLRLLQSEPVRGVHNLHPAYSSLLVKFDPLQLTHVDVEGILRARLGGLENLPFFEPRQVEIPVCYSDDHGPDLADVCALHGLTQARAIELHASIDYVVYFLGFVPGFAYLGELPSDLVTPRLAVPRRSVPPGSVGIAGNQTAVYPFSTPGGWRLLGRTPVTMFRADRSGLSFVSIGDRVRFTPISPEQFEAVEKAQR